MIFEWDEAKRLSNLERHRLDFIDVGVIFSGPLVIGAAKTVSDERRQLAVGLIADVHVTVIFTTRGEATRIISLRRARHDERKRHQALHDGRTSVAED